VPGPSDPNLAVPKTSVTDISTKARFTIQLTQADAGKIITVKCRWKNISDNSKSGPWSNPATTMVGW
jgi:hypothetical protein